MTKHQKTIIEYLEKNISLKDKNILLEYDKNSVVIIDENKILHFIWMNNKIKLI